MSGVWGAVMAHVSLLLAVMASHTKGAADALEDSWRIPVAPGGPNVDAFARRQSPLWAYPLMGEPCRPVSRPASPASGIAIRPRVSVLVADSLWPEFISVAALRLATRHRKHSTMLEGIED